MWIVTPQPQGWSVNSIITWTEESHAPVGALLALKIRTTLVCLACSIMTIQLQRWCAGAPGPAQTSPPVSARPAAQLAHTYGAWVLCCQGCVLRHGRMYMSLSKNEPCRCERQDRQGTSDSHSF